MKELVVCSGKGGTGKTSLTAGFAALAQDKVLVDCDVDAANLHLVLAPDIEHREAYSGGREAVIDPERCDACGTCGDVCRFGAISCDSDDRGDVRFSVDPLACEGCGVCVHLCPADAIDFPRTRNGEWFVSSTRHGPLVHARLIPGAENSGKLVTVVRVEARKLAEERRAGLLLVDGPPGIGCPVTAAITGADMLLAVTEPGVSAQHDLKRLFDLAAHFKAPMAVCINKADINPDFTALIRQDCARREIPVVGEVPFDQAFTRAQIRGLSIVEDAPSRASEAVDAVWSATQSMIVNL